MTADDRDREIARLLEADRRADELAAPPLEALLARPRLRRPRASDAFQAVALAASVALVVATAVLVLRSSTIPRNAPGGDASLQLADWTSPTAFLLDTPGAELLTEVPAFPAGGFEPGADAVHPQPTKGVPQ